MDRDRKVRDLQREIEEQQRTAQSFMAAKQIDVDALQQQLARRVSSAPTPSSLEFEQRLRSVLRAHHNGDTPLSSHQRYSIRISSPRSVPLSPYSW